MAWTNSKVFAQPIVEFYTGITTSWTNYTGLDSDTVNVALYSSGITPDASVSLANGKYAGGVWASGGNATGDTGGTGQVFQAGQWPQGGVAATGKTLATGGSTGSPYVMFDAADTPSSGSATLNNVYGAFVYDDTVSAVATDFGVCFNYFGGTNYGVTSGTLTVVWSTAGVWRATL